MSRVLLIEDEAAIREEVLDWLRFEGYEAVGAANGRLGLQMARETLPDLILCDIMMPVESGYDFVAWYHDRDQDTPIYYVTGLGEEHINRKGVVDVIQKPFSVKDIVNLLEHHCSQQL